jgi:hypothetical protein
MSVIYFWCVTVFHQASCSILDLNDGSSDIFSQVFTNTIDTMFSVPMKCYVAKEPNLYGLPYLLDAVDNINCAFTGWTKNDQKAQKSK